MLEAGVRICGRFELVRSEGEGTGSSVFGDAWAALDLESGDVVRLVFLGEELIADPARRTALRATLTAALDHRDDVLVPLAFVGEEDGRLIVAYEGLYAGIALADVLADLDVGDRSSEVGRFVVEVALALALLHGRGLVHGALSLDTIFVWERGNAVWQYGLAEACDPAALSARAGDHLLAPEVRAGARPTAASDVYGWAASIAMFVSGLPVDEAIAQARDGELLRAATGLVELLRAALSASPKERPASGGAVVRRLVEVGLIALPDAAPDEEAITGLAEAELEPIVLEALPPEVDAGPPVIAETPAPPSSAAEEPPADAAEPATSSELLRAPSASASAPVVIPDFDLGDELGDELPSPVGELPLPEIGDLPPLPPPSLDDFAPPPEFDLSPPPMHVESADPSPLPIAPLPGGAAEVAADRPSALGSLVSAALDLSLAAPAATLPAATTPAATPPSPPAPPSPPPKAAAAPASESKPSAPPPRPAQVIKAAPKPAPAPATKAGRVHVLGSPLADTSGVRSAPAESGSGLRAVEISGVRPAEAIRSESGEGAPSTAALVSVALSTARPSLAEAVDSATKGAPEPDAPVLRRDRRTHPLGWDISEIHAHATVPPDGEAAPKSGADEGVAAAAPADDPNAQDSAVIDPLAVVEATSVPVQPGSKAASESDNRLLIVLGILTVIAVIAILFYGGP